MPSKECGRSSRSADNNNDSHSSSNSDDGEGHVSIACEEASALFGEKDPRGSACHSDPSARVQLLWREVCYTIQTHTWTLPSTASFRLRTACKKQILNNNSGMIESQSLTAVIGPSGAGKSSLLEILAGRRQKGVSGSIVVRYDSKKHASKTKIAFMGQKDLFCGNLTIKETLIFASKLKNYSVCSSSHGSNKSSNKSDLFASRNGITVTPMQQLTDDKNYHWKLASEILDELFLSSCADVHVSSCSGGQQKRLSIACELISRPDILLLDEPTSGLGEWPSIAFFAQSRCCCYFYLLHRFLFSFSVHSAAEKADRIQKPGCHPQHSSAKFSGAKPVR